MTPVLLRRAVPADGAAVADVYLRARQGAVPAIPSLVHDDADVRRWMARVVGHDETWLAQEGEEVVGLLVLTPGWIEHLYVAPGRQGGGVGSRLLALAKDCQPGGLELWTFAANEGARRFYERHGFEAVEHTDGAGNEERAPDVRYHWPGTAACLSAQPTADRDEVPSSLRTEPGGAPPMARATPQNLNESERVLLLETERTRLAELDEDGLIALHERVRRERNKQVQLHRRKAAKAVEAKGARGKATQAPRRSASKAEIFEEALARVSRALGAAAAASAKQLKAERLAAARGERAAAARSAGPAEPATPTSRTAPKQRRPVEKKTAASTRAAGRRTQAKRDAR